MGWIRPTSGAHNSVQVFHVGSRGPSTYSILYGFQGHISRKLNLDAEKLGLEPVLYCGMQVLQLVP